MASATRSKRGKPFHLQRPALRSALLCATDSAFAAAAAASVATLSVTATHADAWTVLRDIAAIFRGITYWSGSEMVFQADRPSDVEFVFSRSNVTDGKFRYTSQSEKTRYSSALVSWDNPDNAYESEPEPVSIPALVRRYGFNQIEITAVGCTRQSEANRRARWLLLTNSSDRGVTFNTGLEGYLPKPGRIIGVADALLAGRQLAGRISQATLNQVTVDRNVQVKAGDRLIVNLPSGKAEARTVKAVAGRSVTVTADFSELPRAQAQWGVESSDLVIQQYRVTKVDRSGSSFEVSGVLHDPGKFSHVDSGTRLESRPISVVPARTQQAPSGVTVTSFTRTEQGLAVTTLRAAWEAAPSAVAYQAEWRKDLTAATQQAQKDLAAATLKAQQDLTNATQQLQTAIDGVSVAAKALPYNKDKTYSVGQSTLGGDGKLYQALVAVPKNTAPPNTSYWADVGQAVQAANGLAARVSTTETKVSELEGVTTAQATKLDGVQSSLTTTNQNVTAAQQVAQAASDLAGGKGKVIIQNATPATADRSAVNLWIDTTGGANTPKRWSGSTNHPDGESRATQCRVPACANRARWRNSPTPHARRAGRPRG